MRAYEWLVTYSLRRHRLELHTLSSLSNSDVIPIQVMTSWSFISPWRDSLVWLYLQYDILVCNTAKFPLYLFGRVGETRKWTRHWGWDSTQTRNNCWQAGRTRGSSCRACAIVHTRRFLIKILLVIKEMWAAMGAEMMEQLLLNLPKREITPDHELHRGWHCNPLEAFWFNKSQSHVLTMWQIKNREETHTHTHIAELLCDWAKP